MSYRSRPRPTTRASTANGNTVASSLPILPVSSSVSSPRCSRETVPSTSGRADRSSGKNSEARSGVYFGWSCMSRRQPLVTTALTTINTEIAEIAESFSHRAPSDLCDLCVDRCARRAPRLCDSVTMSKIHSGNVTRVQPDEKLARRLVVELPVFRFDHEEEPAAAGQREPLDVEHGVIRHRQPVQSEHAKHRRQRS